MARTRQTTRPAAKQATQKKKVEPTKFAQKHMFADCSDCKVNLSKWGVGGTYHGVLCPPCANARMYKEDNKRRALKGVAAVLITQDGEKRVVDLDKESASVLLGGGATCGLYRSPMSLGMRALIPVYDGYIRDNAVNEAIHKVGGIKFNELGMRVISELGCFHGDTSDSMYGNLVVTGFGGLSLFPEEVERIMRVQ